VIELKDRLIVALDVDSLAKATPIVTALAPYVGCFKVGLELMMAVGAAQAVRHIKGLGAKIFLDTKLADIPNTIGSATKVIATWGIESFTVHASCGHESLRAAVENRSGAEVFAVTVLTSIAPEECLCIFGKSVAEKVKEFALVAAKAQTQGIVCSAQELEWIASLPELSEIKKITPGIRPEWYEALDQKRTLTPREAIHRGATHLVIGRPILSPPRGIGSPIDAIKIILEEIQAGVEGEKWIG